MAKKPGRLVTQVIGLLELRQHVLTLRLSSPHSISAFLAWKGLLLTADSYGGATEWKRMEASVKAALEASDNEVTESVSDFSVALSAMRGSRVASPAVLTEWFVDRGRMPSASEADKEIRDYLWRVSELRKLVEQKTWDASKMSSLLVTLLRRIRHATIGHFNARSGTQFYDDIMPAFSGLCAALAEVAIEARNK